ncbi:hypothetical protein AQUCO_01400851v1 [Aquilegia coerulea]|uniref:Thioredoxin domain-containing protein n=1 Tax=Aquilegia coerulea TaxID=218851 RepID=A0A2G5DYE8_AQUCA|nr:hypothetical protein AQUCO_01400851v1 [Aquilegia coerulea]
MISTISRNNCIRCIRRSFLTYTRNHNHLMKSNPSFLSTHLLNEQFNLLQSPSSQWVFSSGLGNGTSMLSHRFLSSSSENQESKKPLEVGSEGGEKASESSKQSSSNAGKSSRGAPVSWLSFLFLITTGAGLLYYYDKEKKKHIEEINNAATAVKQGPSVGKAAIGGPFNLVNHNGKSVTEQDFRGKWTLVYFGFTHCPDICPDELLKLAAAIDKIKEKAKIEIVPVFISVDPERDTVGQVHDYVKEFHPNLVGLTGSADEVKKVARAYRVYYMKTEEEGSDYLVDHSIIMYLMDPNMEYVKFFGKNHDVDSLTDGIIKEIREYKK